MWPWRASTVAAAAAQMCSDSRCAQTCTLCANARDDSGGGGGARASARTAVATAIGHLLADHTQRSDDAAMMAAAAVAAPLLLAPAAAHDALSPSPEHASEAADTLGARQTCGVLPPPTGFRLRYTLHRTSAVPLAPGTLTSIPGFVAP